ncbi:MAG: flavodoxin domain-containing protein [Candidatus Thorarchaeota archaeon]
MTEKVLLCYGSRYGTTTEVVQEMAKTAESLGAKINTVFLKKDRSPTNLLDYDLIIIGSGIRAGQWTREPLKFIKDNLDSLSKQRVALFVVCGYAGNPEKCEEAQLLYLDSISEKYSGLSPVSTALIGGVFDFNKYNVAVRILVKSIVKAQMPPGEKIPERIDFRDWDKIRSWIQQLLQ